MVKEKVLFDIDKFNRLKEDINVYEELMKDVVNVFGSVMNLGIHSGISINRLIKHIGDDFIEKEGERNEFEKKCVYESNNNENMNVNMDDKYDNDMDLIRFTNNGPIFQISKSVLDSLKGSFIDDQREEEKRTNDGTIFLCYEDLFEYCGLPIPLELIDCRERRDTKMKKYEEGDEVSLIINGKKNDSIKDYLVKNGLWNNYVNNYDNGFINYNPIDNSLYMNKKYDYIEYINEYIENETIDIEEDKLIDINKELFEKEMVELFGEKGREESDKNLIRGYFLESIIINKVSHFEIPLVNWLGKEKKWKLLYRASEHNYSAKSFHKCCDNKGETVTLIKHIGHDDYLNIFGGYTDQSWESPKTGCIKPYSKEFLFTLSNEHGIPPTKYVYDSTIRTTGITCFPTYGPVFGLFFDILISDRYHTNLNSHCKAERYAERLTPQNNCLFVNTAGPDEENYFQVEDYEVWGRA
ncbi:hypothetical protein WA158_003605 [Blastocystis sp. Blastoise]